MSARTIDTPAPAPVAPDTLCIVFDGPPGPEAGRFVECETPDGKSRRVGDWRERVDGLWSLDIPHALPMSLDRALELCSIVNSYALATMGVGDVKPLPSDVTLLELVQAGERVRLENDRTTADALAAPEPGRTRTYHIVPDPRLIAAVYAIEHFPLAPAAIIVRPATRQEAFFSETARVALAVVPVVEDADDDEDDEG